MNKQLIESGRRLAHRLRRSNPFAFTSTEDVRDFSRVVDRLADALEKCELEAAYEMLGGSLPSQGALEDSIASAGEDTRRWRSLRRALVFTKRLEALRRHTRTSEMRLERRIEAILKGAELPEHSELPDLGGA